METPLLTALGDKAAKPLARQLGLTTVGDLLRHYPRRYVENSMVSRSAGRGGQRFRPGEHVTLLGTVERVSGRRMRNRKGHIVEATVSVGERRFTCTFFNQPYREHELSPGTRALFSGDLSSYQGKWQLAAPDFMVVGDGRRSVRMLPGLIPIYPATRRLRSWVIMQAVRQVLDVLDAPADPLPETLRADHGLASVSDALHHVHWADSWSEQEAARRRLVWDEAFGLQLALQLRRATATSRPAPACPRRDDGLAAAFDRRLPFTLTGSQHDVGASLSEALATTTPLNRLLQGDVGSGKTIVALRAMLQVVDSGRQAVLLAPTEVLAAQHARSLRALLGPLGRAGELDAADTATAVTLLTGSLGARARRQALLDAQSGAAGIVVGTHAVIQQGVGFADLGLVVVDEQHRFGVHQRDELRSRSGPTTPHVLVMTATPIPRTVALTLYGDLDTSVLAELPAGRRPIRTTAVPALQKPHWLDRAWERVHEEVAAGHQVYVVCPRIGGDGAESAEPGEPGRASRAIELRAAPDPEDGEPDDDGDLVGGTAGTEPEQEMRPPLAVAEVGPELAEGPLTGLRLEILHGRLPAEEKDAVMRAFGEGAVDVLVATTVVEVGVDVPNATMMVILDADRFGVSQLHQLRGRVGRGAASSSCLLVTDAVDGSPALRRLEKIASTTDGFAVAELDLALRDEGDVLGAEQSGRQSGLHMLSVLRHGDLIAEARDAARAVVSADPTLAGHAGLAGLVRSVVGDEEAFLDRL